MTVMSRSDVATASSQLLHLTLHFAESLIPSIVFQQDLVEHL